MVIIHGDNQVASRQYFTTLRSKSQEAGNQVVNLSGDILTLENLVSAGNSVSLFGTTNALFIEGFFSRRPSNDKKSVIEYLTSNPKLEVIFWEGKDVSPQLKGFPATSSKKFDLPRVIWQFLDTLSPILYRSVLTTTEPEQLVALLAGRIRQLIIINAGETPPGLAAWQTAKLKSLAAKFTSDALIRMHTNLLELDYRQKTSASAFDLASALEVWLLTHVR